MFSRLNPETSGTVIPAAIVQELEETLERTYREKMSDEQNFIVYGELFPKEVLLAASLYYPNMGSKNPVTFAISADLTKENDFNEKMVHTLIDCVGVFFDQYFQTPDWNDYNPQWVEDEFNKQKFFYQISRENLYLFQETQKLLRS